MITFINVALMFIAFVFLARFMEALSDRAINIVTRFGGLIVATIGVQLAFAGIKNYFDLGSNP